jgi:hypothetical protein
MFEYGDSAAKPKWDAHELRLDGRSLDYVQAQAQELGHPGSHDRAYRRVPVRIRRRLKRRHLG